MAPHALRVHFSPGVQWTGKSNVQFYCLISVRRCVFARTKLFGPAIEKSINLKSIKPENIWYRLTCTFTRVVTYKDHRCAASSSISGETLEAFACMYRLCKNELPLAMGKKKHSSQVLLRICIHTYTLMYEPAGKKFRGRNSPVMRSGPLYCSGSSRDRRPARARSLMFPLPYFRRATPKSCYHL